MNPFGKLPNASRFGSHSFGKRLRRSVDGGATIGIVFASEELGITKTILFGIEMINLINVFGGCLET